MDARSMMEGLRKATPYGARRGPEADGGPVIITGDMQVSSDDNSLDLFDLRDLCSQWWSGQGDPLYQVGSNLYSKQPWSQLQMGLGDSEMGYVLTLTNPQWREIVRAARNTLAGPEPEHDPNASEDAEDERVWRVAEHILKLDEMLSVAEAVPQ